MTPRRAGTDRGRSAARKHINPDGADGPADGPADGADRPADAVAVRGGRRAPDKTDIHNWVGLSGIEPEAIALYNLLRMHVHRDRGDDLVWTSQLSLAVMMGKPRADKISPLIKALADLKAIDVHRVGMPAHNEYTVHQLPPPGYTGPTTLRAWYALHKPLINMKRAAEQATRDARRRRKAAAAADAAADAAEPAPVTPDSGQPVTPISGQPPVTLDSGQPVTPVSGQHVAPDLGREVSACNEPPELEPPPTPATSNGHGPPPAPPPEQDDWDGLADELMAAGPPWAPPDLRAALADPRIRQRPFELVRLAFLMAAQDGGETWTPARLLAAGCPYWTRAHRRLNPPPAPPAAGRRPAPRPHPQLRLWCGEPDCDPVTRHQVDEEGKPCGVLPGFWAYCPRCGPDTADSGLVAPK